MKNHIVALTRMLFAGCGDDCNPSRDGNGSISRFTSSGAAMSQPDGYQGGPLRAQGLGSDADGNIWISSFADDSVYVFIHGNPHRSVRFHQYDHSGPFDVAIAADGTAWVTNTGGLPVGHFPRSVAKYALVNGVLEQQFQSCRMVPSRSSGPPPCPRP
jgi:streptogramin lyase